MSALRRQLQALAPLVLGLGAAGVQAPPVDAGDAPPEGVVRVELEAPREAWFEGETLVLRLRVAVERRFLAGDMLQLFQQRLDLPVQVHAPWLAGTACLRPLPGPEAPQDAPRASFVLGETVVRGELAQRELDGRDYAVVELERRFAVTCPGELVLPGPSARFAFGAGFVEDPFAGRVPGRRSEATVRGPDLALWIRPLPEEGRPPQFGGAIGRFAVAAEAHPRELAVGESLRLVLRVTGEGDLRSFEPPRLRDLAGFRVLGMLDEPGADARTLTYSLAPESALVEALPSIPFVSFDPSPPPGYRTVWTAPIPLEVRPAPLEPERPRPSAAEPAPAPDAPRQRALDVAWALASAALATAALAWLVLRLRARRRGRT